MNVGVHLTIHWTNGPPPKEIPNANAWISLPETMPYYGTSAFKDQKLDIFILKSYRDASTYDEFARTVSHELSHVVLESIQHPLRREEKAVDLTGMLLGFSDIYRTASHTVRWVDANHQRHSQLGYLSKSEMDVACGILIPPRLRRRHALLNFAQKNVGLLTILGIGIIWGAVWATNAAFRTWDIHGLALSEQARIERLSTGALSNYVTVVGVRAGLTSVTTELVIAPGGEPNNVAAVERNLHRVACATNGKNIKKGLSYIYEYPIPNGATSYALRFPPVPRLIFHRLSLRHERKFGRPGSRAALPILWVRL